jgi:hypothetical protein
MHRFFANPELPFADIHQEGQQRSTAGMTLRTRCRKAARGMDRTGLRRLAKITALCAVLAMFLVAPATAQIFGRNGGPMSANGEPTDPDAAYVVTSGGVDVDLSSYGLSTASTQSQSHSWVDAVIEFLRNVGLLPAKDANG